MTSKDKPSRDQHQKQPPARPIEKIDKGRGITEKKDRGTGINQPWSVNDTVVPPPPPKKR